jgi:cytochrome c biogenesis protein CcmG/thiol:disulfide interchange protein DsbE
VYRVSVLIALLVLLLSGCYSGSRPPRIGTPAPNFTAQDSEQKFTLSDFRGKVVVLNFWASWCPPCIEETPSLVQLQHRLKNKGVTVVGISWDDDSDAYHQFIKDHQIDFLTVRDSAQNSGKLYGTLKIPETYIIDRNGIIRRKFISSVDWSEPEIVEFLNKM